MAKRDYEQLDWKIIQLQADDVITKSKGDNFGETPEDWWKGSTLEGGNEV